MDDLIYGRNPVREAFRTGTPGRRVLLLEGRSSFHREILALSHEAGVPVEFVDRTTLQRRCQSEAHQGVALEVLPRRYAELDEVLETVRERGETPLLVLCDHIGDPQNLGAIIRSAACFGAHGVVIPRRRSAPLNAAVVKASAGCALHLPVISVNNLASTIRDLQGEGFWVAGADPQAESPDHPVLDGPLALVVGNEGRGLSPLTARLCDCMLGIPMAPSAPSSLNASVAAGILLFEVFRRRNAGPGP